MGKVKSRRGTEIPSPLEFSPNGEGENQLDLTPLSHYLEERFHLPPFGYLQKTDEGLTGNWLGNEVRIKPTHASYRRMRNTLKLNRGIHPGLGPGSSLYPVFRGKEWVGCIAAGGEVNPGSSSSIPAEAFLPFLGWVLGNLLENRRLWKMLERTDRQSSLGFLSAGVFHEIRNPLTALSTLVQLLPIKKNDSSFMDSFQSLMLKELDRLELLTDQSLRFARGGSPAPDVVCLEETLGQIHQLIRPSLGRKKIQIKLRVDPGLKLKVDPVQFESLVVNLLKNAISAVGEKGTIQVSAKRAAPKGKGKSRHLPDGERRREGDRPQGDPKDIRSLFHHPHGWHGIGFGHLPPDHGQLRRPLKGIQQKGSWNLLFCPLFVRRRLKDVNSARVRAVTIPFHPVFW